MAAIVAIILFLQLLALLLLLYRVGILVARGDLFLEELEKLPVWANKILELQRDSASQPPPPTSVSALEEVPEAPGQLGELQGASSFSSKVEVVREGVTLQVLEYSPDLEIEDAVFNSPRHCLVHQGVSYHEKQDWLRHCKAED